MLGWINETKSYSKHPGEVLHTALSRAKGSKRSCRRALDLDWRMEKILAKFVMSRSCLKSDRRKYAWSEYLYESVPRNFASVYQIPNHTTIRYTYRHRNSRVQVAVKGQFKYCIKFSETLIPISSFTKKKNSMLRSWAFIRDLTLQFGTTTDEESSPSLVGKINFRYGLMLQGLE